MPDLTPGFDPPKINVRKKLKSITKPVRKSITSKFKGAKKELRRADKAIFGGGGLKSNLEKLKKERNRYD